MAVALSACILPFAVAGGGDSRQHVEVLVFCIGVTVSVFLKAQVGLSLRHLSSEPMKRERVPPMWRRGFTCPDKSKYRRTCFELL